MAETNSGKLYESGAVHTLFTKCVATTCECRKLRGGFLSELTFQFVLPTETITSCFRPNTECQELLHPRSNLVTRQSQAPDHSQRQPPPKLARCPTEEMSVHWRSIVTGNFLTVDRTLAGAVCAVTHEMSRWRELQRTSDLSLTKDAITGKAEMKNRPVSMGYA